ncbi:hypothetical protein [Alteromonas sp. BZK5]|uniref:hypothetical protein n=1 Tax=Alteromonas sp. BZK5 TaxID=1904459 RepID=UPI001653E3D7|nr:hypothetical protein [Alteromonas sp. BZK5]MBC6987936.1 hypothetical protein [Alteromonas sp. BZK5]
MRKALVIILLIFLCPPAFSEQMGTPIRVDDFRLTHPFKAGLVKGASLGLYKFERHEMVIRTPYDAQLPIGFEAHVRNHGRFAYYTGAALGATWTILVFSFFAYGIYLRWSYRRKKSQFLIGISQ